MSEPAFSDRYWTSHDGLKLHARDYAAAPGPARTAVICIHGLTRNARDFENLRRDLQSHRAPRDSSERDSYARDPDQAP